MPTQNEWEKEIIDCWSENRPDDIIKKVKQLLSHQETELKKKIKEEAITEDTSDGFHTFKELYEFRKIYNALIFNEWAKQGIYNVHKSWKHNDGELCFGGGWFIVSATLPSGQISNHYEGKDWSLFTCEEREIAEKWDGHTTKDVAERILTLLSLQVAEDKKL